MALFKVKDLALGAKIADVNTKMGDVVIPWTIVGKNHYDVNQVTLFSGKSILTAPFDSPEPTFPVGPAGGIIKWGNNNYALSNTHQWLNSAGLEWFKKTHDYDEVGSPYDRRPGFLTEFSDELKDLLLETKIPVTLRDVYEEKGNQIEIKAKVFLPSVAETGLPPNSTDYAPTIKEGSTIPWLSSALTFESLTSTTKVNIWTRSFSTAVNTGSYASYITTTSKIEGSYCTREYTLNPMINIPDTLMVSDENLSTNGYYTIDFTQTCVIDGRDKDLGKIDRAPSFSHQVSCPSGVLRVKAKLNGQVTEFYNQLLESPATAAFVLPNTLWNELEYGSHNEIVITAEADSGATVRRVYQFTKVEWTPGKDSTIKDILVNGLGKSQEYLDQQKERISNKLNDCGIKTNPEETLKGMVDKVEDNLIKKVYPIYTVVIDLDDPNPTTACTYADDAVGMTPMKFSSPANTDWQQKFPYNMIKPCVFDNGTYTPNKLPKAYVKPANYRQWLDATTSIASTDDVMIEIPIFYHRVKKKGRKLYVSICGVKATDEFVNYAHLTPSGTHASRIYMAAYLGYMTSSKIYSQYGKTPSATFDKTNARTYVKNRGAQMINYHMLSMIQILFVIAFKTLSAHSIASGNIAKGSLSTTGTLDTQGMYYAANSQDVQVKLFGIEDIWGNHTYSVDGLKVDSYEIKLGYKDFDFSGSGYTSVGRVSESMRPTNGRVKDVVGNNELPFFPCEFEAYDPNNYPQLYFCDNGSVVNRSDSATCGSSNWNASNNKVTSHLFGLYAQSSEAHQTATRLVFVPNY